LKLRLKVAFADVDNYFTPTQLIAIKSVLTKIVNYLALASILELLCQLNISIVPDSVK